MFNASHPSIVARDLSARRGGRTVFDSVSLTIGPGDLVVLRGANGAGKTTLLRTLSGLSAPSAGVVNRSEQSTIFLGHADGIKNAMTARENIEFWIEIYGSSSDDAEAAVGALKAATYLQQRASTLSAGQRRRLALCRAVISKRPIWVLDEPTAGMDTDSIAAVIGLITDHRQKSGAALIATHERLDLIDAKTITLYPPEEP